MRIHIFRDLLAKKYGIDWSLDQLRKLEYQGLFKPVRTPKGYRVYDEGCIRPIILYFLGVPKELVIRDNRDELKPYLARIRKAIKEVLK